MAKPHNRSHVAIAALLLIFIGGLLLFSGSTSAQEGLVDPGANVTVTVVWKLMATYMFNGLTLVNSAIAGTAQYLNYALRFKINTAFPVVSDMWKIVRDFANMLFIVVLIIIAFGTIFNISALGFGSSDMFALLGKFLIAAILINFSLVISGVIMNGVQTVNDTFMASIGDFSARVGGVLDPAVLTGIPSERTTGAKTANFFLQTFGPMFGLPSNLIPDTTLLFERVTLATMMKLTFTFILALIILFSLLTAAVVATVRIPIIMTLLVLAPAAWLFGILPSTRAMHKQWWTYFMGWNLFMPFFLFILYFGLYFLARQNDVITTLVQTDIADYGHTVLGGISFTIQSIFFYFMVGFIFIGGTTMALKASFFTGSGVANVARWGREKLLAPVRLAGRGARTGAEYLGGAALEGTGIPARIRGVKEGLGARFAELEKEGVLPGLGRRAREQAQAQYAETFGMRGAVERQLKKDIGDYKKSYEDRSESQLRAIIAGGSKEQKLAAYELLKDKKALSAEELLKAYTLYGRDSVTGKDFAKDIDFEKLEKSDRKLWFENPDVSRDIKRRVAQAMAKEGEFENARAISSALMLLEGKAREELFSKAKKTQLIEALRAGAGSGLLKDKAGNRLTFVQALEADLKKRNPEDLLKILSDDLLVDWSVQPPPTDPAKIPEYRVKRATIPEVQRTLKDILSNPKMVEGMLRRGASSEQAAIIDALRP